jgi:PIN domain-containing protein
MGLGKALAYARKDVVYSGHPLVPYAPTGALDEEWIPAVGSRALIVIGRDRHMRTRPGEVALWKANSLRVFYIADKRDLSNWEYMGRVRRWSDIERAIQDRGPGPWFFHIFDTKVKRVPL